MLPKQVPATTGMAGWKRSRNSFPFSQPVLFGLACSVKKEKGLSQSGWGGSLEAAQCEEQRLRFRSHSPLLSSPSALLSLRASPLGPPALLPVLLGTGGAWRRGCQAMCDIVTLLVSSLLSWSTWTWALNLCLTVPYLMTSEQQQLLTNGTFCLYFLI